MRERGEEQWRERGWRRGDGEDEAVGKREGEVMEYNGAQKTKRESGSGRGLGGGGGMRRNKKTSRETFRLKIIIIIIFLLYFVCWCCPVSAQI